MSRSTALSTSPPYWGLREYGIRDQIGLENAFGVYLEKMRAVFDECRRVLRSDGTCWLNIGDSYASSTKGSGGLSAKQLSNGGSRWSGTKLSQHVPEKNLCGIPWRLAFALQESGWYLRCDIIWSKPNPMPESVTDRPTKSHEYIFLLTKSAKYWYDAEAIRTPAKPESVARQMRHHTKHSEFKPGQPTHHHFCGLRKRDKQRGQSRMDNNPERDTMTRAEEVANGANARSVWEIATVPYSGEHYATFPPELPKRCILAGCPEGGMVLDPFAGTGTTLAVAMSLGRHSIGIELNPAYIALARKRIAEANPSLPFPTFPR